MKLGKIILGFVGALILLMGGFAAGSFVSQTRIPTGPAQQFSQPTFLPQQLPGTPIPQSTLPVVPPQGQWEPGWGMRLAPGASAGVNPNYSQGGRQGWGMMHDWHTNQWRGMHDRMMGGYGWQANPNWNLTPTSANSSSTYHTPSTPVSFRDDVQPIFAARCAACHGGTNGLYLDTYDNVLKGGINGAVVIPGDVYNSRLAFYVYSGYMPFRNTPLTSAEVQTILDWIALDAPNN